MGLRFMPAQSPPSAPKIGLPVTLKRPRNQSWAGARREIAPAAPLLPQARKPVPVRAPPADGCLADAEILGSITWHGRHCGSPWVAWPLLAAETTCLFLLVVHEFRGARAWRGCEGGGV